MTILFMGGEIDSVTPSDSSVVETTSSGTFDSAFARCSIRCDSNTKYFHAVPSATAADIWLHFDIYGQGKLGTNSSQQFISWKDSGGVDVLLIYREPTLDTLKVQYWNGSAYVLVDSEIALQISNQLQTIDVHVVCNTSSGSIDLYVAGTRRIASGTLNLSHITAMGTAGGIGWGGSSNPATNYFSQIVIATESTIGMHVGTIPMTGNGASTTWTGDYTAVDEIVYSDADFITSSSNDEVETYTGTPVPSFTGYTIRALSVYGRTKKTGSNPAQVQMALRSSGTTYFSSTIALDFGYGPVGNIWETNPATSVAFLSSEISALQYGQKSKA